MRTSVKIFAWLNVALLAILPWVVRRSTVRSNRANAPTVTDVTDSSVLDPNPSRPPVFGPTLVPQTPPVSQRSTVSDFNLVKVSENSPAVLPLVFRNITNAVELSEQQLQTFAELQKKFVEDLGGIDQDPSDPAYRQKWQVAQQTSDDLLLALLGGEFYLNYELETSRSSSPP